MRCEFRKIASFEPNSGQCVLSHLTGPPNVSSFFHSKNSGPEPQECGCDFSRDIYSAHPQCNIEGSRKTWATNQYCVCTHPFPMRVGQKPLCDISQSKLNTQVILIFPSALCLGEGMWRRILVEGYGSVGLGVSGVSITVWDGRKVIAAAKPVSLQVLSPSPELCTGRINYS